MAELGRRRAKELGREIDMRVGDAEALDFPDESFDTVLCTYGFCTTPDDRAAVREAKRVLRPGGRLLLAEHVRSPKPIVRTIRASPKDHIGGPIRLSLPPHAYPRDQSAPQLGS